MFKLEDKVITISLPSDLYEYLEKESPCQGNLKDKIQLYLSIGMFVTRTVSLKRAAEYAGMDESDFIKLLGRHKISIFGSAEEIAEDYTNA